MRTHEYEKDHQSALCRQDKITVNGKSVEVYIDGRPTYSRTRADADHIPAKSLSTVGQPTINCRSILSAGSAQVRRTSTVPSP